MNTLIGTPKNNVVAAPTCIPANSPPRILVVEDDEDIRQFTAQVLSYSGYQVATAEDGVAGWQALQANNFDLLITDYEMPRLSGLELLNKARGARMTLPVILASATWHAEELASRPWLQLAVALLKPFSAEVLLEAVKMLVSRQVQHSP